LLSIIMVATIVLVWVGRVAGAQIDCACRQNIFVDASIGEDSDGSGCEESPLKSILAAVQCAWQNCSINVWPGTYVGGNISITTGSNLKISGLNGLIFIDGDFTRTVDIEPGAFASFDNVIFTNGHALEVGPGQTLCAPPLRSSCPGRFGGAIRATNSEIAFSNVLFKSNTAMCGGAISLSRANATFTNCTFEENGGLPNAPPFAL
jgi:hypothetical protein